LVRRALTRRSTAIVPPVRELTPLDH